MEITIKDIKYFKLTPSLISFIKCIYNKNQEYLIELNNVADVFIMAKHLEKNLIIKVVGDKIDIKSFEIRNLDVIKYLNNYNQPDGFGIENLIDDVINYFKQKTGKNKTSNKSESNRKLVRGRLKEYDVIDLKNVIDLKVAQWTGNPAMKQYLRIETLFNATKFQSYIGETEDSNDLKDFADDI